VDTVGGWIFSQLSEQPQIGDKIVYRDVTFEIAELENLRINRVLVSASANAEDKEDSLISEVS
jgi:CBS domain containing-hemolysin-like protein